MVRRVFVLLALALLALHAPNGDEIYVKGDEVVLITPGGPPLTTSGCRTDLVVHDKWICVKETPKEVRRLVEGDK